MRNQVQQIQNYLTGCYSLNISESIPENNLPDNFDPNNHEQRGSRNRASEASVTQKSSNTRGSRHPIKINNIVFKDHKNANSNVTSPLESALDEQECLDKCSGGLSINGNPNGYSGSFMIGTNYPSIESP